MKNPKHIALFLGALGGGGAERVALDLARAFSKRVHRVDLVLSLLQGELVSDIPSSVRVIELGISRGIKVIHTLLRLPIETWSVVLPTMIRKRRKKVRSLPGLERYLLQERPNVLIASTNVANLIALWATRLARTETCLVIKQDNSLSQMEGKATDPLQRRLPQLIRRWYPRADKILAVSNGLANELSRIAAVPRERISVIYNPIDLGRVAGLADQDLDDPWFQSGQPPVLLAVGRLHRQKDYPTLLRAFARVKERREARLVILGEGQERPTLEGMIRELRLAGHVRLAGFQKNPFAYMARAAAFLLSSAWEGLSNVLIEALACGCRVVSTDCQHGPAEILDNGRYGMLVPVGNPEALAAAIGKALEESPEPEKAKKRASEFGIEGISEKYLQLFCKTQAPSSC